MDAICMLLLLSSRLKSSFVSVVFDFNASLIDATPASPMLLSVDFMRMNQIGLLMDVICVPSVFVITFQVEFSECCV